MAGFFKQIDQFLIWQSGGEKLYIQPWGKDGIRVQATQADGLKALPGALLQPAKVSSNAAIEIHNPAGGTTSLHVERGEIGATLTNGKIRAEVTVDGLLRFTRADSGQLLVEEAPSFFPRPPARQWDVRDGDLFTLKVRFAAQTGERFYGLGQHQHGFLDQKGCVIELMQRNTEVCIPFLVSSRGYGLLWNNPGIGKVELAHNGTTWEALATRQMDYFVTTGDSYAEILEHYADATGHPTPLPEWALGFWQCKLRYVTQEELLSVAREYKQRGLPLSIIVIDFYHWTRQGDWMFDPQCWSDPAAMVKELRELGVEVMVSVWPTVSLNSIHYDEMAQQGLLIRTEHGVQATNISSDIQPAGKVPVVFYDATNPEARRYIWEKVRQSYYNIGIRVYWLDADEPEIKPVTHENLRYHLGNGLEVGCIYPLLHQQGFYEGLKSAGETDIIALSRSGWAGSQRYGMAIWSGDIRSTFASLNIQVRAGLNIAMSGIPWWTTDIGGFFGGEPANPDFRELLVRWFQYGAFCPLFRLHGYRLPAKMSAGYGTGADNEVWSYGDEAYAILRHFMFIREKLRPYLAAQGKVAEQKGTPPMRPLFFDFNDPEVQPIDDQFMLGPDLLVAPVLEKGAQSRAVYLPTGANWIDAWNGDILAGGQSIRAVAPLARIPVYWRQSSPWFFRFDA